MDFAYNLSGISTPLIRKFQAGETMATRGVPVLPGGGGHYGLRLASTTAAVNCIGVTLDTQTVVTAQQTDNSDTSRLISVIVNPDAVFSAPVSGGATTGTALAESPEATGSSDGLAVDTAADYSSPSLDEGALLCTSGANKGLVRPVTSLSSANAVLILSFPRDTAIGDKFVALPWKLSGGGAVDIMAHGKQYVQLGTTLEVVDASVTIDTDNANFIPLRLVVPPGLVDVLTQTRIEMKIFDHLYDAIA